VLVSAPPRGFRHPLSSSLQVDDFLILSTVEITRESLTWWLLDELTLIEIEFIIVLVRLGKCGCAEWSDSVLHEECLLLPVHICVNDKLPLAVAGIREGANAEHDSFTAFDGNVLPSEVGTSEATPSVNHSSHRTDRVQIHSYLYVDADTLWRPVHDGPRQWLVTLEDSRADTCDDDRRIMLASYYQA